MNDTTLLPCLILRRRCFWPSCRSANRLLGVQYQAKHAQFHQPRGRIRGVAQGWRRGWRTKNKKPRWTSSAAFAVKRNHPKITSTPSRVRDSRGAIREVVFRCSLRRNANSALALLMPALGHCYCAAAHAREAQDGLRCEQHEQRNCPQPCAKIGEQKQPFRPRLCAERIEQQATPTSKSTGKPISTARRKFTQRSRN